MNHTLIRVIYTKFSSFWKKCHKRQASEKRPYE